MDPKQTAPQGPNPVGPQEGQTGSPVSSAGSVSDPNLNPGAASPIFSSTGFKADTTPAPAPAPNPFSTSAPAPDPASTSASAPGQAPTTPANLAPTSAPSSQPEPGTLGAQTLSTGADVSRTMDTLNNTPQTPSGGLAFKKHTFDKIDPGTGDILLTPDTNKPKKSALFGLFGRKTSQAEPESVSMVERKGRSDVIIPTQFQNSNAIINEPADKSSSKKRILIIVGILILVAAIIGVAAFVLLNNSGKSGGSGGGAVSVIRGSYDLDAIFDETAPIPVQLGDKYGYVSPSDGSWVINAQYTSAERFYGDYAIATSEEGKSIIDRTGKVVTGGYYSEYIVDYNLWSDGTNIYDGKMTQVNPKNSNAQYIDRGYMAITPGVVYSTDSSAEEAILQEILTAHNLTENDLENLSDTELEALEAEFEVKIDNITDTTDATNQGTDVETERPYVMDVNGKVTYTCPSYLCTYNILGSDNSGNLYVRVSDFVHSDVVVNLRTGETIANFDSIEIPKNTSIPGSDKYYINFCEGGSYGISLSPDSTNVDCKFSVIGELPDRVYARFTQKYNVEPVLIFNSAAVNLYNMNKDENIRTFSGINASTTEDSSFIIVTNSEEKFSVCNIFVDNSCLSFDNTENTIVRSYGDYFTVEVGDVLRTFNLNMLEVTK